MLNRLKRERLLGFPQLKTPFKKILRSTFTWQHSFMVTRGDLPFVLNAMNLLGTGAEIGVSRGKYSLFLLTHWRGAKLYSIDPWHESMEYRTAEGVPVPQATQDAIYAEAVAVLAPFGARSVILRQESVRAAEQFQDGALDFCFIDGNHEYESVKKDLEAWFPKVKRGGIVAGHDYVDTVIGVVEIGVKTAVDEFCRARGVRLILTHELDFPSWFIFK